MFVIQLVVAILIQFFSYIEMLLQRSLLHMVQKRHYQIQMYHIQVT